MGSALGIGVLVSYGVSNIGALMSADKVTNQLMVSTKGANSQLTVMAKKMAVVGAGAATMAAGIALATLAVGNIKAYAGYQESMLDLQGLLRNNSAEMERFTAKAREMARTYAYTAGEVADAMWRVASAGFTQNEVLAMTETVLRYATIGNMETADAAFNLSNVMRAFAIPASEAEYTLDRITATMSLYQLTMADFQTGFATWGMVAANTNQSMEEMLALWGSFTSMGLSVSRSGMMVKMMLTNLMGASPQSRAMRQALGVDLIDEATGEIRSLIDVMDDLQSAFANPINDQYLSSLLEGTGDWTAATEAELYALTKIFGRRAVAGFLGASGLQIEREGVGMLENFEAIRHDADYIKNQFGYGVEYTETMMSGINYMVENIKTSFATVREILGEAMGFQDSGVLEWILDAINTMSIFLETHPEIAKAIGMGLLVGGAVLTVVGAITAIAGLVLFIGPVLIGKAILIGMIIGGVIASIVAAGIYLASVWENVKSWAINIWENYIRPMYESYIKPALEELRKAFLEFWVEAKKIWPRLKPILEIVGKVLLFSLWGLFKLSIFLFKVYIDAMTFFLKVASWMLRIEDWWNTLTNNVLAWFYNIMSDLEGVRVQIVGWIVGVFKTALDWVISMFPGMGMSETGAITAFGAEQPSLAETALLGPLAMPAKLMGFASGTMSVPRTGLAIVHEDEEIIQAGGYSNRGSQGNTISLGGLTIQLIGSGNTTEDANKIADIVIDRLNREAEMTMVGG